MQHLLTTEGEQLFGEARGTPGRLGDLAEIPPVLVRHGDICGQDLGEPEDDRQQIVEIVGDARSQSPDGVHLVGLPDLRLERPPFGDVLDDGDEMLGLTLGVAMDGHVDSGPHEGAVPPSITLFIEHVAVTRSRSHLTQCLRLASHFFRLQEFLNGISLQLVT